MANDLPAINREDTLRYMGYREQPDERICAEIDECEHALLKVARPQYVWRVFDLVRENEDITLEGCDFKLPGKDIARHLEGCEKAAVISATLSSDTDRFLKKLDVSDGLKAMISDALASVLVEQVVEEARKNILDEMKGYSTTWCYAAGYGDFPVEMTPLLIASVDAVRKIGVCCTAMNMITPQKTIVGVLGISQKRLEQRRRSCGDCNMCADCKFRADGVRCI